VSKCSGSARLAPHRCGRLCSRHAARPRRPPEIPATRASHLRIRGNHAETSGNDRATGC
jgi:hypothetical protein